MKTPFSTDQFLAVFEKYNTAVFPAQIIIFLSGVAALVFLFSRSSFRGQIIALILSALWLWNSIIYQFIFFREINPAATVFTVFMGIQAFLMLYFSLVRKRMDFSFKGDIRDITGLVFVIYGLLVYPAIDLLTGHSLSGIISAGLPCPTTILTLGFFILASKKFPAGLLIIPSFWALLGINAALHFGIYQDFVMVLAAILTLILRMTMNRMPAMA